VGPVDAAVHGFDLGLELFDQGVALLQILVETVPLRNELLLPLSEALFLDLDLFGEALAQGFFLFLELGIVKLARTSFAEFAGFHLLGAVCFVVILFRGMDKIQHVGADENGAELLEVAMLLILDFSYTPGVLATLDGPAVAGLDILLGSDDGEGHGSDKTAGMDKAGFIVLLKWGLVDLDALGLNDSAYLLVVSYNEPSNDGDGSTYPLLELQQILWAESIGLGDNRNEIDTRTETLHDLNVKRLQGVAGWANEVKTSVDAKVNLLGAARLLLLQHVGLMLIVKELDNWLPRVSVVDVVSESRSINDGQADCRPVSIWDR
jgi:hypothetical protein